MQTWRSARDSRGQRSGCGTAARHLRCYKVALVALRVVFCLCGRVVTKDKCFGGGSGSGQVEGQSCRCGRLGLPLSDWLDEIVMT